MKWTGYADILADLGAVARERREAQELTQEEASHRAGLSVRHYAKFEQGRTNATIETAFRVATVLELDFDELVSLAARRRGRKR